MQENFGKRLWRLFYPLLTYTGISYLVSFIFSGISLTTCIINNKINIAEINILEMNEEIFETLLDTYIGYINEANALTFVCTIPLFVLYMHMDKKRKSTLDVCKKETRVSWYKHILLPVLGVAACVGGTFMIILGGWELTGMNNISDALFIGKPIIEMLALGILYPIMNELLYRGLLYNRLKEQMSKHMAALMISLLIAFYSNSLVQGIYAFLLSVLCIYVYERFRSIIAPILVSMGASIITVLEKEYEILGGLYSSWGRFVAATMVACAVVVVLVLAIEKSVLVKNSSSEPVDEIKEEQV